MNWLQNLPIKRKLTLVILMSCSAVLLLACGLLAGYELYEFKRALLRDMTVLADVLATNTKAALAFQDENAAHETLMALRAELVRGGASCLYTPDGTQFADYAQAGAPKFPAKPAEDGYRFEHGYMTLFRPVMLKGKRIGTIYLQADMAGVYDRLRLFGGIGAVVLSGSILVGFFLSSRLQRPISEPILALAETARVIAEGKDYSVRATKRGEDEVGRLTDAFNHMLGGIADRENALRMENIERKQAEISLRKSEAQLQTIVENLGEGVVVASLDGRVSQFNHAALEMHGFSSPEECRLQLNEFTNLFVISTLDGQVLTVEEWPLARVLRGEKLQNLELRIRRIQTGVEHIFNYGGTLVYGAAGQPLLAVVTINDITERKRADTKLRAQLGQLHLLNQITRAIGERKNLRNIFQVVIKNLEDHLPIQFACVCLYDQAGTLTVISTGDRNDELAARLNLTEQTNLSIGENGLARCVHGHVVYEPDTSQLKFPFPQRLAEGGLLSLVIAPMLVESQVFGILLAARAQANAFSSGECEFLKQLSEHIALAAHQAQLYNALQVAYDDLRQTQQAVMQQERLRALGQMASGIAHDINNAISPVALYTESLLENEPNLSPRARGYLETIQHSIEDVAATVARMREFYRQREPQLTLTPIQLNRLVEQVMELSRARWGNMPQQRGITINVVAYLMPDLPAIMGVESEIREALINLIFNAVDAMPEGGTLTLRTKLDESRPVLGNTIGLRHALIEVVDTGVGMNEETRRRCLEPFFTTKGERGTGLGLAMVYGMVQRNGAEIEIDSAVGRGTTMRLSFPVPATPTAQPVPAAAVFTVPTRLRILVVDDDPLLLKSLRDILETNGHVVTIANGGQAGIDAFGAAQKRKEPFAVVITDLGMPYIDGRKVANAIKESSPATPVIMLTGWGQRLIVEGDVPPNVDRVLSKPPKLRELREALAQCMAAKTS